MPTARAAVYTAFTGCLRYCAAETDIENLQAGMEACNAQKTDWKIAWVEIPVRATAGRYRREVVCERVAMYRS
ncbi:MAG TPA: hypothetical protein VMU24_07550, partial [Candidatus Acidoferrales bacterium]|nr:hypothetical protein [Candidatus Acidoferrales bacterium]